MNEVRTDPARPLFGEHQGFLLNSRQAADSGADRATCAKPHCLGHVEQSGILDRLSRGVDPEDDERVDLALDLMVNALVGVEAIFMIRRLHLASNVTLLIAGVEMRNLPRARFAGEDVRPRRLDVRTQRRHQPQSCHHYTAHILPQHDDRPKPIRAEPVEIPNFFQPLVEKGHPSALSPCSGQ